MRISSVSRLAISGIALAAGSQFLGDVSSSTPQEIVFPNGILGSTIKEVQDLPLALEDIKSEIMKLQDLVSSGELPSTIGNVYAMSRVLQRAVRLTMVLQTVQIQSKSEAWVTSAVAASQELFQTLGRKFGDNVVSQFLMDALGTISQVKHSGELPAGVTENDVFEARRAAQVLLDYSDLKGGLLVESDAQDAARSYLDDLMEWQMTLLIAKATGSLHASMDVLEGLGRRILSNQQGFAKMLGYANYGVFARRRGPLQCADPMDTSMNVFQDPAATFLKHSWRQLEGPVMAIYQTLMESAQVDKMPPPRQVPLLEVFDGIGMISKGLLDVDLRLKSVENRGLTANGVTIEVLRGGDLLGTIFANLVMDPAQSAVTLPLMCSVKESQFGPATLGSVTVSISGIIVDEEGVSNESAQATEAGSSFGNKAGSPDRLVPLEKVKLTEHGVLLLGSMMGSVFGCLLSETATSVTSGMGMDISGYGLFPSFIFELVLRDWLEAREGRVAADLPQAALQFDAASIMGQLVAAAGEFAKLSGEGAPVDAKLVLGIVERGPSELFNMLSFAANPKPMEMMMSGGEMATMVFDKVVGAMVYSYAGLRPAVFALHNEFRARNLPYQEQEHTTLVDSGALADKDASLDASSSQFLGDCLNIRPLPEGQGLRKFFALGSLKPYASTMLDIAPDLASKLNNQKVEEVLDYRPIITEMMARPAGL